ncbi:serine/threonine-protein kinase [Streptomyces sp. NPDC002888]|uniref:serine/threonine-protein kinase n=1 Tax=Streptomyces sp. NPDC002888 TaxID=3364668 RepID=UPI0036920929
MDALKAQDPARIGAHTLLARLGAGGMGQVYLGRSPGGRLVAIKVIRDEITDHPEALARFRREVETVRAVRSAYTANLIDASLDAAPLWLATEYVPGPTLSKAVGERGPLPAESARRLFAALAEALASVHRAGVTHRDLKPQNVILSPQGPVLIDFGIARGAADTALTQTGLAPGTPGYTAPEVIISNQVGAAADVFALGATLAYAATGRPPFGSGPTHAVSYRAVHEDIDTHGAEPELAELIRECVAKDPAQRPGLDTVIARCVVTSALTDDPFYGQLADGVESVPENLAAAVAAGLVPPGHGAPTPPAYAPTAGPGYVPTVAPGYVPTLAPSTPTAASERRRSRRTPWLVAIAVAVVVGTASAVVLRTLDGSGGSRAKDGGSSSSTSSSTSATASAASQKAPDYILNDRISRDYWTLSTDPGDAAHGIGSCKQVGAVSAPEELQYGVDDAGDPDSPTVKEQARITFRFKYAEINKTKPEPYYVSVGVKPPHEIDSDTGKPYEVMMESKNIGYTSKPLDIYKYWKGGKYVELTYPDDFQSHYPKGQVDQAIPVANDPGDWTAVFYHVKGSPTDYESVGCTGFRVGSS